MLEKLNYSSLYDLTRGQYFPSAMDFWYYLQQPEIRKAANLGNRTFSDGIKTYTAMIHDTMQTILPQLIEIMENYKVLKYNLLDKKAISSNKIHNGITLNPCSTIFYSS